MQLFKRLEANSLVVNRPKCVFGLRSIDFLDHRVSADGIAPLEPKVTAVRNFHQLSTVKELQHFLGMRNFYHRFVPHIAEILVPLALHTVLDGRRRFTAQQWTPEMESAFYKAKNALADATLAVRRQNLQSTHRSRLSMASVAHSDFLQEIAHTIDQVSYI